MVFLESRLEAEPVLELNTDDGNQEILEKQVYQVLHAKDFNKLFQN